MTTWIRNVRKFGFLEDDRAYMYNAEVNFYQEVCKFNYILVNRLGAKAELYTNMTIWLFIFKFQFLENIL